MEVCGKVLTKGMSNVRRNDFLKPHQRSPQQDSNKSGSNTTIVRPISPNQNFSYPRVSSKSYTQNVAHNAFFFISNVQLVLLGQVLVTELVQSVPASKAQATLTDHSGMALICDHMNFSSLLALLV